MSQEMNSETEKPIKERDIEVTERGEIITNYNSFSENNFEIENSNFIEKNEENNNVSEITKLNHLSFVLIPVNWGQNIKRQTKNISFRE
jgi:hypothetical protein